MLLTLWSIAGWSVGGLVGLALLGLVVLFFMVRDPVGVKLGVEAPATAQVGDVFMLVLRIENELDRTRQVGNIDIDKTYLSGIVVENVQPLPKQSEDYKTSFDYIMGATVPARGTLDVRFRCKAVRAGDFTGEALVYPDGGHTRWLKCVLRTVVTE